MTNDDSLRQALRWAAVGELSSRVAHESNNLLAGILGQAELGLLSNDAARMNRVRPIRDIFPPVRACVGHLHRHSSDSSAQRSRFVTFSLDGRNVHTCSTSERQHSSARRTARVEQLLTRESAWCCGGGYGVRTAKRMTRIASCFISTMPARTRPGASWSTGAGFRFRQSW